MTLTIDVSAGVNVPAGLGRYTRSLVTALLELEDFHHDFGEPQLFYNHIPGRSQPVSAWKHVKTRRLKVGYKPWRMAAYIGQLGHLPFNALVPGTTLFHATEHLLMPLWGVKTVLTVHDLIFKLFPEHHKKMNYWFLNRAMPLFVKRADAIIAISEATKRDLITHYDTPASKITVIYEAAEPIFRPQPNYVVEQVRNHYHLPDKYILVVGTIEPRKNYTRLLEAMVELRKDFPDLHLVIVGSKGWLYESFLERIKELKAEQWVIFPGFIPDDDLAAVYQASTLYVMASFYEGFGLPVLEAMASGAAVVTSNTSSLPELGGNDGTVRYFSPHSLRDMVDVLGKALKDKAWQKEARQKGVSRAAQFSWERTAQETMAVYQSLF